MPSEQPAEKPEQPKASVMLTLREIAEACILWASKNRPGVLKEGAKLGFHLRAHPDDSRTYARLTEE